LFIEPLEVVWSLYDLNTIPDIRPRGADRMAHAAAAIPIDSDSLTQGRLKPGRYDNEVGANVLTSVARSRHLELVSSQSADSRIGQALHGMTQ
jgi:hypothetical protein